MLNLQNVPIISFLLFLISGSCIAVLLGFKAGEKFRRRYEYRKHLKKKLKDRDVWEKMNYISKSIERLEKEQREIEDEIKQETKQDDD